jgi:23S rRNA-/tRNA-specific pseudouridylate synthase
LIIRHEHPIIDIPIEIIADTDHILVIDKPPSMPVHRCGRYHIHTVVEQLRLRYGYVDNQLRGRSDWDIVLGILNPGRISYRKI